MKKIIILASMFVSFNSISQDVVYCELIGKGIFLSNKVKVTVNYGKEEEVLLNYDGRKIKFVSMIDALNYMSTKGWFYTDAYVISHGDELVYHYIMKK